MLCYVGYHVLRHDGYAILCHDGCVILRHMAITSRSQVGPERGPTMLSRSVSVANLRMDRPSYASAPFLGANSTRRSVGGVIPNTPLSIIPNTPLSVIPSTHGERMLKALVPRGGRTSSAPFGGRTCGGVGRGEDAGKPRAVSVVGRERAGASCGVPGGAGRRGGGQAEGVGVAADSSSSVTYLGEGP